MIGLGLLMAVILAVAWATLGIVGVIVAWVAFTSAAVLAFAFVWAVR